MRIFSKKRKRITERRIEGERKIKRQTERKREGERDRHTVRERQTDSGGLEGGRQIYRYKINRNYEWMSTMRKSTTKKFNGLLMTTSRCLIISRCLIWDNLCELVLNLVTRVLIFQFLVLSSLYFSLLKLL